MAIGMAHRRFHVKVEGKSEALAALSERRISIATLNIDQLHPDSQVEKGVAGNNWIMSRLN